MKTNLKSKIVLALLVGNMLCMGSALAGTYWYGDSTNARQWNSTTDMSSAVNIRSSDANLTLTGAESGFADVITFYAGYSTSTDVTDNILNITGGDFTGKAINGGFASDGSANNNTVNIIGGNFGNSTTISGGAGYGGSNNDGNVVSILGGSFDAGFNLNAGHSSNTNSVLNLKMMISSKAGGIYFFQKMNFTLPNNIANGDTMLCTSMLFGNSSGVTINVDAANGVKLNAGDVITLVDSDITTGGYVAGDILGGVAELYDENTLGEDKNGDTDNKDLVIVLLQDFEQKAPEPPKGNYDQQKAPVEGIAAGVAMINQSADLAMGEGMQNLLKNTANTNEVGEYNVDTFGAVTGTRSKYKTGSHVDLDGWGALVGVGTTKQWTHAGKTTYGVFFEYGKGDFDTYNNAIHGEGESINRGAGIMARHTLKNNTYYEGSIRYGKQKTDWNESEIGGYNTDSKYYGISAEAGHIYSVNNGRHEIDVYGRYTYGHVGGSDATVGDNEYHFDAVKSNRVKLGAKMNFNVNKDIVRPYFGLAWEHEFSGECKASISDVGAAPSPRFKGHTGIVEAGINWEANKNMQLGIGAEAYMGKRKGWSGNVNGMFNF